MDKIPENAKKVFEGILFDVYQWEQEQFDGSKKTFEMVERIGNVTLLAVVKDKILLLKEEQPGIGKYTGLPGGMIERKLSPEENAKKELLEETGYTCKNLDLFYFRESMTHKILQPFYLYIAKDLEKVSKQNLDKGGERIEPYLVPFEEFLEEIEKPEFNNTLVRDIVFRMKHTEGELEKFKKLLFN